MYQQQQQQPGYPMANNQMPAQPYNQGYPNQMPPQQYNQMSPQPYNQQGYAMANNQMPGQPIQYQNQQPGQQIIIVSPGPSAPQEWKSSLCGCFSDIGSCLLTMFCPCVQYGLNYEKVHKSGCCSQGCTFCCLAGCGCGCLIHKELRHNIRQRRNIPEGCSDCLVTWCCGGLAICQEARELKDEPSV